MVRARHKKAVEQSGVRNATNVDQVGSRQIVPPPANRGGKEQETQAGESLQSGTDRARVNVSLPPGIYRALSSASEVLGSSLSSVALMAITAGLPALDDQVTAVSKLGK